MTHITFERGDFHCQSELAKAQSIGIDLNFGGSQPNHFGAPAATASPLRMGNFVGATSQGGSCNVVQISLIPHCNGTHTETVGHIVDALVPVCEMAPQGLVLALLISTETVSLSESSEHYHAPAEPNDQVVTAAAIQAAFRAWHNSLPNVEIDAMVIRTLPNSQSKQSRAYQADNAPAYLTTDCMQVIDESSVNHLLIDLPSVDRMHDDGKLSNHHLFWNVVPMSRRVDSDTRRERTITEMIFVPDELPDGLYLLNLQTAPFVLDAAPSRPILFTVQNARVD
jgi:kynurenine formamidase